MLLAFVAPAFAEDPPPEAPAPEPAVADRDALAEIVRAERVATRPERPSLARYVQDVLLAVIRWFSFRLERVAPGIVGFFVGISRIMAWVMLLAAVVLLLIFGTRLLLDRRRARSDEPPPVTPVAEAAAGRAAGKSREAWAEDLRRHLGAGDVAAACEALWWWLARSIVRGSVERSWTSRELLARAGRRDLAPPVRRLDRAIYGAAAPSVDEVRRLWGDFEEILG